MLDTRVRVSQLLSILQVLLCLRLGLVESFFPRAVKIHTVLWLLQIVVQVLTRAMLVDLWKKLSFLRVTIRVRILPLTLAVGLDRLHEHVLLATLSLKPDLDLSEVVLVHKLLR